MAEEETTEQVEEAEEAGDGEKSRTKAPTWMFNDNGVAYAPWMVDSFDPEVRLALQLLKSIHSQRALVSRSYVLPFLI